MVINIGLSFVWVNWLGFGGLALANTAATTLEMMGLLWLLDRRLGGLERMRLAQNLILCIMAAWIAGMSAWAWTLWLAKNASYVSQPVLDWLAAGIGIVLLSGVYLAINLLLRNEELLPLVRRLARR
jgi:putative peptidoglycan lipid II flippase